jgi:hypothetical protein
VLGFVSLDDTITCRRITDGVAGGYDIGAISAQHSQNTFLIAGSGSVHERIGGLFWVLKDCWAFATDAIANASTASINDTSLARDRVRFITQRILIMGSSIVSESGIPLI